MLYDHRRHTRYALMAKAVVTDDKNRSSEAMILDIDIGGWRSGISTKLELALGDALSFRLHLPGTERAIYIQARVQWTRQYGAVGCEFLRIPPVDVNLLHDWLTSKNQVKKPLVEM